MPKRSINLLIPATEEKKLVKKLKTYLPFFASAALLVFVVAFLASYLYIYLNKSQYAQLQKENQRLESLLESQKTTEGMYTATVTRAQVLRKLLGRKRSFGPLLQNILAWEELGVVISSFTLDKSGGVTVTLTSPSSENLETFVKELLAREESTHIYSYMSAQGVRREKDGSYGLSIQLRASPTLIQ